MAVLTYSLVIVLLATVNCAPPSQVLEFTHHNNEEMYNTLTAFANVYPEITHLYSIGKSVKGNELMVLIISDNPSVHEPGEPELKYIGNMHGNEVTGRETLLHLIELLCTKYGRDPHITQLVDTVRIHIMPTMNPDGYSRAQEGQVSGVTGRANSHGIDLNRNFPDRFGSPKPTKREPETAAVMKWIRDHPFVLSINFHNGALLANYPYDNSRSGVSVYQECPDDDIFRQLALAYSTNHATMSLGKPCPGDRTGFRNGITNGAAWYSVSGGMQDFNYLETNCFEITVEQGCEKFPWGSKLEQIWYDNERSLIKFIEEVQKGVRGFITCSNGSPIEGAKITVTDRDHPIKSVKDGDYWRLLVPGQYTLIISADGYEPFTTSVIIPEQGAVQLNVTLLAIGETTNPPTVQQTTLSTTPTEPSKPTPRSVVSKPDEEASNQNIEVIIRNDTVGHFSIEVIDLAGTKSKKPPTHAIMVASIWLLVIICILVLAVAGLAATIACQMKTNRVSRKGFAPVPLEEVTLKASSSERGYFTNGHDISSSDEDVVGDFSRKYRH